MPSRQILTGVRISECRTPAIFLDKRTSLYNSLNSSPSSSSHSARNSSPSSSSSHSARNSSPSSSSVSLCSQLVTILVLVSLCSQLVTILVLVSLVAPVMLPLATAICESPSSTAFLARPLVAAVGCPYPFTTYLSHSDPQSGRAPFVVELSRDLVSLNTIGTLVELSRDLVSLNTIRTPFCRYVRPSYNFTFLHPFSPLPGTCLSPARHIYVPHSPMLFQYSQSALVHRSYFFRR